MKQCNHASDVSGGGVVASRERPAKASEVGSAHGVDRHTLGLPHLTHTIYVHGVVLPLGRGVVRLQDGAPGQGVASTFA